MRTDYLAAIVAYLLVLIGVGVVLTRRVRTPADFMVAGRRLPLHVLVGTLVATWIGTGSLMGNAGLGWRNGFAALWAPLGGVLGIAVVYFVAARARRFGGFTVPDVLEARYHPAARVLATLVTVVAYTVITSYQFRAGGRLLHLVTGMEVGHGVLLTTVFVIAYTALAGMLSVAYTDFVNGIIMVVGLAVALPLALGQVGGISSLRASLGDGFFAPFHGEVAGVGVLNLMLPSMLLLMGESNMYGRFFSARTAGVARRAVLGWIAGVFLLEAIVVSLGVVGRALYPDLTQTYAGYVGNASEVVIPHLILHAIHPTLGILLLAAMAAVVVSTADSFLLTPATNLVNDVYKRFLHPDVSAASEVWLLRAMVVVLGVWAYLQVEVFPDVLKAALYAYTMYGAAITPAVLAAFFWKRATAAAGVASVATGMATTGLWKWVAQPRLDPAGLGAVDAVIPAMALSVAVLVAVSYATPPPDESRWQPFFRKEETAGS